MTDIETYGFDRQGYIVLRDFLGREEVERLSVAIEDLEAHALAHVDLPPRKASARGREYHVNGERGYHVQGAKAEGRTLVIEDFWNADPAFDFLVNHEPTMAYIRSIVQGHCTINNSELRIRYTGNTSGTHGGYRPTGHKYTYRFNGDGIDCGMVRMVYFVQDVSCEQGAFCVVPGTHKSNMQSPYGNNPDEEPGMVGLEVAAGDAILFTENLRHGGLTNRSEQTRKTLHVGYGPFWLMSQNTATMDEPQYLKEETLGRFDAAQRNLFRPWPEKEA